MFQTSMLCNSCMLLCMMIMTMSVVNMIMLIAFDDYKDDR